MTPIWSACCSTPKAGIDEEAEAILSKLATVKHPKILVLNKIDLIPRERLLALAQTANDRMTFDSTFMISALTGDGVDDCARHWRRWCRRVRSFIPRTRCRTRRCGIWRRKSLGKRSIAQLHQELPYQSTVETDSWTERKDGSVRIEQTIFVERESQRKIVLGKGGATIKAIGADVAQGNRRDRRRAGASVPVRQGARELGRRPGTLQGNGPGIPERMSQSE